MAEEERKLLEKITIDLCRDEVLRDFERKVKDGIKSVEHLEIFSVDFINFKFLTGISVGKIKKTMESAAEIKRGT